MGILLDWLGENRPDIMALQETKVVDADFPVEPLQSAGYHVAFRGEKSYNGVAILSVHKPEVIRFGLDDGGPADETRFAYAKFGELHVINTYIPQGRDIEHEMYRYKIEWFARLRNFFARHFSLADQVVWVGDFNVAPTPIDIHNSEQQANHVCYHVDVRNAFADVVSWGFEDVLRKYHPEAGQYTFFDYRQRDSVKRGFGWRIDFVMASKALSAKSVGAGIDLAPRLMEKPSDHTVLMAEFRL